MQVNTMTWHTLDDQKGRSVPARIRAKVGMAELSMKTVDVLQLYGNEMNLKQLR